MISGYVLRNGQYGTQNLTVTGRTTIPHGRCGFTTSAPTNAGAGG